MSFYNDSVMKIRVCHYFLASIFYLIYLDVQNTFCRNNEVLIQTLEVINEKKKIMKMIFSIFKYYFPLVYFHFIQFYNL